MAPLAAMIPPPPPDGGYGRTMRAEIEWLAGSADNARGVALALSSSLFIGASFIIKKKGLLMSVEKGGSSASAGGFSYLRQPVWWLGMLTMIGGESANFIAYAYAPAILVTPLGAATIAASAVFARFFLGEDMHICGIAGILLCTVGTVVLVRFAPEEAPVTSVEEVWSMAMQPVFRAYVCFVLSFTLALVYGAAPKYGKTHVVVYVAICSMIGSLSVMALRGIGIAAKLTMRGSDQLRKRETLFFILWVGCCIATQMNYLNKALDTFNTTMVSSVYYVFFTVCTVTASMIMYKDWENQTPGSIFWQVVALLVNVVGVHVLSGTRDSAPGCRAGVRALLSRRKSEEKPEYTHLCACDDDAEQQQQQQQQQQHGGASRRDWLESRH